MAPGEVRRRADLVVIVGKCPPIRIGPWWQSLPTRVPDLSDRAARASSSRSAPEAARPLEPAPGCRCRLARSPAATLAGAVGRPWPAARPPLGDRLCRARRGAGDGALSRLRSFPASPSTRWRSRCCRAWSTTSAARCARIVAVPAATRADGAASLASTWMTGFPLRTGFARGRPEFDPWRFEVARMMSGWRGRPPPRSCQDRRKPAAQAIAGWSAHRSFGNRGGDPAGAA